MKIYVSHATGFDYKTELYAPLTKANNQSCQIYLPHEKQDESINTRGIIESSDLVFAEVSYPSTGQGFELAWAYDANVPIVCVHKQDVRISSCLKLFSSTFHQYADTEQLMSLFQVQTRMNGTLLATTTL